LERNAVNHAVVRSGAAGAWSRLERGELGLEDFYPLFEADCRALGVVIDAREMMRRVAEITVPRPALLEAIRRLRPGGPRVAALTNNWITEDKGPGALRGFFDVSVESVAVGLPKPDPRIYELVCRELAVAPSDAVFLDDIGSNLKTARALGMKTIKVDEPDAALAELERVVGLGLR